MTRSFAVFVTFATLVSTGLGQDEVPLSALTSDQMRGRLEEAFKSEGTKLAIAKSLAKPAVPGFATAPSKVDFVDAAGKSVKTFEAGKTRLVWKYSSTAALSESQAKDVTTALREVLFEAFVQFQGGTAKKSLLTDGDGRKLADALDPVRETADPPKSTRPTISAVSDGRVRAGDVFRTRFTVSDAESPPAELEVTAASSNPDIVPPAHISITGSGGDRELAVVTTQGQPGTVQLTLKVTDPSRLFVTTIFTLTIDPVLGGGGNGGTGGNVHGYNSGFSSPSSACAPLVYHPVQYACVPYAACAKPLTRCGLKGRLCNPCVGFTPTYVFGPPVSECLPSYGSWAVTPGLSVTLQQSHSAPLTSASLAVVSVRHQSEAKPDVKVVQRDELLKGKRPEDWAWLYDAGYRDFWAGRYAQAAENCAAAAELSDDPRAWYYLSFAKSALGEAEAARAAARYAAAKVYAEPERSRDAYEALSRVQGLARSRLGELQAEVQNQGTAPGVLAARPGLRLATGKTQLATAERERP